jgi:outer membrane protein assembly factor BamD (BamD/ComL family)
MHAKKHLLPVLMLGALAWTGASAQAAGPAASSVKATLDKGIELFGQERYRDALELFGKVVSDPRAKAERPEAAYWSALAYLAAGDQATAGAAIDAFIAAYPKSPRLPDLLYQRGRLLYAKGDYEGALKVFAAFSSTAPLSDLIPSALYWSGECLYALGRL